MDRYGIITNVEKDKDLMVSREIRDYLEQHGKTCTLLKHSDEKTSLDHAHGLEEDDEGPVFCYTDPKLVPEDTECVLVLGGDGTLIQAARDLSGKNIPLLGVNFGTLGYLAGVEKQHILPALDMLMEDRYTLERRMMLDGTLYRGDKIKKRDVALNDIVISRGGVLRVIDFKLFVNGEFLNLYSADGIVIATPTGSTAYNMSAGGPIVSPEASLMVVTPICPHTLNTRSIILSAEDTITIELCTDRSGNNKERLVSFDGDNSQKAYEKDSIKICRSRQCTNIIKLNKISFLEILRKKMSVNV